MTIQELITKGKGQAGAWRVSEWTAPNEPDWTYHTLWHYSTAMMTWRSKGHLNEIERMSLGRGSASDQNGMNTAFRVIGAPLYFSRAGGAEIRNYETGQVMA